MATPNSIVVGMLPTQFEEADAQAIIGLAAAVIATMASIGNSDPAATQAALQAAGRSFQRMRPEARDNLAAVAEEMVDALKQGKEFMVLGGFRKPTG